MTQSFYVQPIKLRFIGHVTPVPTTLLTASGNHICPTQSDCAWVNVFTVFGCFVRKYELLILRGTCHIKPFLLSNIHIKLLRRWCSLATSCQQLATSHRDSFLFFFLDVCCAFRVPGTIGFTLGLDHVFARHFSRAWNFLTGRPFHCLSLYPSSFFFSHREQKRLQPFICTWCSLRRISVFNTWK